MTAKLFNFAGTNFYDLQKLWILQVSNFTILTLNLLFSGIKLCEEKKINFFKNFMMTIILHELLHLSSLEQFKVYKMSVRIYMQIYILATLLKSNSN